ncbi:glycosyltransferase family 2 protein [Staphylococcus haemolyticus]|nr:glycosyltransferase family 2 protein [Staphylococcus haemolyticus]
MAKVVSIIVSVYNKEHFLKKCRESLIDLKIDKSTIEAIFVDDCSTDQSVDIIKAYEKEYDFIKLIQLPENTGSPSEPRNIGMREAQGKYITLLDADDWLDKDGFPQVIEKVNADDADFGLGQSYKHTSKNVAYHSFFTSYKDASHLKPQDISKLFRAVGPPGKVFKRSLVMENHIEFEHMKYGEDKLFFFQLFSKVENITMSTKPMYHVNRYDENKSLVQQTSMLDKASLNLAILDRTCRMDMPTQLKHMALSRMVEVDFISRFLRTKTFIKSIDKQAFYAVFDKVEQTLNAHGIDINTLITNPVFKQIYTLYHHADESVLIQFTKDVVYNQWRYIIQDGMVFRDFVHPYDMIQPTAVDCYPVYEGTQMVEDKKYEVIHVMKPDDISISSVSMVEINNAFNEYEVTYQFNDNRLYIAHDEFKKLDSNIDVNFNVKYGESGQSLVYASYPSFNDVYKMKRQSFKVEFIHKENENQAQQSTDIARKYFTKVMNPMMTLKKIKVYKDLSFNEQIDSLEAGARVEVSDVRYTSNGTPRLILKDDSVITANKDFITLINTAGLEQYITKVPETVKIIKACKLYDSRNFKDNVVGKLKKDDVLTIKDIIYTKNATPRLVTQEGLFLTANKDFIEIIK